MLKTLEKSSVTPYEQRNIDALTFLPSCCDFAGASFLDARHTVYQPRFSDKASRSLCCEVHKTGTSQVGSVNRLSHTQTMALMS